MLWAGNALTHVELAAEPLAGPPPPREPESPAVFDVAGQVAS